jgi:hypothetical protein
MVAMSIYIARYIGEKCTAVAPLFKLTGITPTKLSNRRPNQPGESSMNQSHLRNIPFCYRLDSRPCVRLHRAAWVASDVMSRRECWGTDTEASCRFTSIKYTDRYYRNDFHQSNLYTGSQNPYQYNRRFVRSVTTYHMPHYWVLLQR